METRKMLKMDINMFKWINNWMGENC
jgi:hypothetical protein